MHHATPMKISRFVILPAAAGLAVAAYTLDWSTLDAGGGQSSGGPYTVAGTIGQTDPAKLTGGAYTLTGGFWSMPELLQTPGGPPLQFHHAGGITYLRWPAPSPGWRLETSTNLTAWTTAPGLPALSGDSLQVPADLSGSGPRRLYRLTFP